MDKTSNFIRDVGRQVYRVPEREMTETKGTVRDVPRWLQDTDVFLCPTQDGRHPKFVSADMEPLYVEELRSAVNLLMANLESLPVSKGGPDFKQKLKRSTMNNSFLDMGDEGDVLSKSDVVLSFTLEVCVGVSLLLVVWWMIT